METFGKEILNRMERLTGKILGRIVFDQPEKLQKLNAIVHPAVNEKDPGRKCRRRRKRGKRAFYSEAALLTEPVYREMLDEILVYSCATGDPDGETEKLTRIFR